MASFWDSWQLWEKMTFVLALGIVVTILAGCVKLVHQHLQLRNYMRAAEERRFTEGTTIRKRSSRRGRNKADIPFGVRAIESGIEVDGVWISRPNSIIAPPAGSPTPSSIDETPTNGSPSTQSPSQSPDLLPKIPSPTLPRMSLPPAAPDSGYLNLSQHDYSETPQKHSAMKQSLLVPRYKDGKSYKPRRASQLRFSTENAMEEESSDSPYPRSSTDITRADRSFSGSSTDSDISGAMRSKRPQSQPFSPAPTIGMDRGEIDMLPFTRHSTQGIERLAKHGEPCATAVGQDPYMIQAIRSPRQQRRPIARPLLAHDQEDSSGQSSAKSVTNLKDYRSEAASEANQSRPALASSLMSGSNTAVGESYTEAAKENTFTSSGIASSENDEPMIMRTADPTRSLRASQVIRKVNSGFEILQPGTFGPKINADFSQENEQSLDRGKRQPRKLHKKKCSISSVRPEVMIAMKTP